MFLLWLALVVKCLYERSKIRFVYVLAALFMGQAAFTVIAAVMYDMVLRDDAKVDKFYVAYLLVSEAAYAFYFQAHWLFCWKYWKMAELLAEVSD